MHVDRMLKDHSNEVNFKPHTISTGVIVNSKFMSIERLTQSHIRACFSEQKLKALRSSDHKYNVRHESIHSVLTMEQWESIFLVPQVVPVDDKTKEL